MPRNGSGTYTLPVGPFTPGTVISSSDVNSDFSDIATALTASLAADGQTQITGQLKASAGANPSYTFAGDTNTGFGSSGPDVAYIVAGGTQVVVVSTTAAAITGNLTVTGTITPTGGFTSTITVTGSTAGFVAFQGISTEAGAAAGPILALYRNSATPAASDFIGAITFNGNDSGANATTYGYIQARIVDPTDGSEDTSFFLNALVAGVDTTILKNVGGQIQIPGSLAVTGNITGANIKPPTKTYLLSGTSLTYSTPANCTELFVQLIGGGGGGGGTAGSGSSGSPSAFDTVAVSAGGGGGSTFGAGGAGGSGGSGVASLRLPGSSGCAAQNGADASVAGSGGAPGIFGTGAGRGAVGGAGGVGGTNTGAGGAGGGGNNSGAGGGAGEYAEVGFPSPAASYVYTVGPGGAGGAGTAGGTGAAGIIIITEYYS